MLLLVQRGEAQLAVTARIQIVVADRRVGQVHRLVEGQLRLGGPMIPPGEVERARHAGVAAAVVGVELRRMLEQAPGVEIGLFAEAQAEILAA